MELSLELRIGSVFLILVVSALGFGTPFLLLSMSRAKRSASDVTEKLRSERDVIDETRLILQHPFFMCVKTFSAGVILGVAVLHLLSDSLESLDEYSDYPG